jgi:hypothetical protein
MKRRIRRLLDAYKHGHACFKARGCAPKFERLDNETSKELQDFMQKENISFQYVSPNCKRRNAAGRAIRTFKNHFIATLCTVETDFPLQLWDTLLPKTELCLNLLRGSRLGPRISAWDQLHGKTTSTHTRSPHLVFVSSCMKNPASADHGRHMGSTVSISDQHFNIIGVTAAGWLRHDANG